MRWQSAVGALLCAGGVALAPGSAATQTRRPPAALAETPASIVGEWQLRGVAITDRGPIAILEHRASGRDQLLRVGDSLRDGVAITAIAPERVVLEAAGQDVTLRLGHGGPLRAAPPPPPAPPRWPRSRIRPRR
ncbi:MAG: hypothetical protein HYR51_17715 [Candidatus Rokubacteria bacterium]|nr:hypothetical protein [Candidatus Rokubacteria bacterium]